MATAGQDGVVKVWDCRNWKGTVRQWTARGGNAELEWSQRGALAVATGGSVNVRIFPSKIIEENEMIEFLFLFLFLFLFMFLF